MSDGPSVRPLVRPSVRLSVRRSVGRLVPCYFQTADVAIFEGKGLPNDTIIYNTMSDDEVVASDVPPRYLLYDKTCINDNSQLPGTMPVVFPATARRAC